MKHLTLSTVSIALFLMSGTALAAENLALKRVMLSTGGVGYFEYEATVNGDATLPLSVRLDQVNDVLKSIVVYDDRGGVGEVSLPGKEPLREAFRNMPFSQEALTSPVGLLNALRGAEVRTKGGLTGRILSVIPETVDLPNNKGTTLQHRVSVMTTAGLRQFILENTDSLEFVDPKLQAQVTAALMALARDTAQDSRTLSIHVTGAGQRTVRVAYVAETPLWKTTYRLTVPQQGQGTKGQLQGWAVLENVSGEDWKDVDLTVASGNPVTFRQQLFEAYYVYRPEVPVEVFGRVLPPVDQGAVVFGNKDARFRDEDMAQDGFAGERAPSSVSVPPMPQMAKKALGGAVYDRQRNLVPAIPARMQAADGAEAATQVTFHVPQPVSVPKGHSVLLPIISRDVPVDPVSFYQYANVNVDPLALVQGAGSSPHPLAAVRVTNDSDVGLPPGVLTLYERQAKTGDVAYVGDARLAPLPAGEDRMVSFAVDQKVKILREGQGEEQVAEGKIADGILELSIVRRDQTVYTLSGAAKEDRTVVIEHPKNPGWNLVSPDPKNIPVTDNAWRIRQSVSAGKTVKLAVVTELPEYQRYQMIDLSVGQIEYYAQAKRLSDKVRQVLVKLKEYSAAVQDAQIALSQIESQLTNIENDQARLRQNLGPVPKDSDVAKRYLKKMLEQEDMIEDLEDQRESARKALEKAQKARLNYVRGVKI